MHRSSKFIIIMILCYFSLSYGELSYQRKALLWSLTFPGAGQIYNKSYIKAGIYSSLEIGFFYGIYIQNKRREDAIDKKSTLLDSGYFEQSDEVTKQSYDITYYRKQRDIYIWLSIVTYLLSVGDAYVDAHFLDFKKDIITKGDKLSFFGSYNKFGLRYSW